MKDCRAWVWEQAREIANQAHAMYCRAIFQDLYVIFTPGNIGIAATGRILQPGERIICEKIPNHRTPDQNTAWIAERLMREPCLPVE